jgi:transposase-like protein
MFWNAERREQLAKLRAEGQTMEKIANELGCSLSTVSNALRPPPRPPSPAKPELKKVPGELFRRPAARSVPMRKHIDHAARARPQPTKPELLRQLAQAVRNTAAMENA